MIDAEGIVFVALFLFWIWALLDCIATDSSLCRNLPKPMWIILIIILPDIGSLIWLLLGRPERSSWRPGSADYAAPRRPVGVEDSPRYSPSPSLTDRRSEELDRQLEQWEREQREREGAAPVAGRAPAAATPVSPELDEWQQQLDQREADLKRRELELRERELDRLELEQRARELDD